MKFDITKKIVLIALIGMFSQFSMADNASAMRDIAGIVASINHFPSDADKVKLAAITADDTIAGGLREMATAVASISHATNAEGKEARRRLMVYAGDHYITNVGTKYSDGGTLLSLRDIAPQTMKHTVELEILKDGKKIHTMKQAGTQGPVCPYVLLLHGLGVLAFPLTP